MDSDGIIGENLAADFNLAEEGDKGIEGYERARSEPGDIGKEENERDEGRRRNSMSNMM
ncbi:MAG: hypothetical protein GY821_08640 [Gammaproteobacteria bacterium]|nr:hypothetical protein [Gammaproteobacteria bacterium]